MTHNLIDVHHHLVPPFYLEENRRIGGFRSLQTGPAWAQWTPQRTLDVMDANGVATSILSISMPGIWFGDVEASRITARRCNEYAAKVAGEHPGRFGFFAAIPLPHPQSALEEIAYALDVLGADGVSLFTSYDGKWLGHSDHWTVFEELNRRQAVVHVHPTIPEPCRALLPDVRLALVEAPQDTTRAVINMLFTGALSRFRGVRFILSHAGGFVPVIIGRLKQYAPADIAARVPDGFEFELRRLYYDIAGSAYLPAIRALTSIVPTSQILFGSDEPPVALDDTSRGLSKLGFTEREVSAIGRDNALQLFPRLAAQ